MAGCWLPRLLAPACRLSLSVCRLVQYVHPPWAPLCSEIKQFCDLFGIEFRHGSVGRPNVQGQVENKNRGAQDALRSLLLRYPSST